MIPFSTFAQTPGTWTQITPAASPSSRFRHAMVYDSRRDQAVLFGGLGGGVLSDLWAYHPLAQTWEEITQSNSPGAHLDHPMAYDSLRDCLYVHGGITSGAWYNSTWKYDLNTNIWTDITPATGLGYRANHTLTFVSSTGKAYAFGGYYGQPNWVYSDLWEFDPSLNTWEEIVGTPAPGPRSRHGMVYDPNQDRLLLFGGKAATTFYNDLWEFRFDTRTWSNITPPQSPEARMNSGVVFLPEFNQLYVQAGDADYQPYRDLWVYAGDSGLWTKFTPPSPPQAYLEHTTVNLPSTGRLMTFGGLKAIWTPSPETWEYSVPIPPTPTPTETPEPTATPTSTPNLTPFVALGGYWDTRLSRRGGPMKLWFYILAPPQAELDRLEWGGLSLPIPPERVVAFQTLLPPGLPQGNVLFEATAFTSGGIPSSLFPYLPVTH